MKIETHPIISPKKLIEVALPLDAINMASQHEKSVPRRGHPATFHLWWARRPLAAARAVIFSQLVHDPEDLWRCQNPRKEPNAQVKGHWTKARVRLFSIIEDLVKWENTTNEQVLERAREEIRRSWRDSCELNKNHPEAADLFNPGAMPCLYDPFAGGGAIPLEAQRLGIEAYASDLNPVAVLINKAMIEIPPKFANMPPVRRESDVSKSNALGLDESWSGASGLAEDVRYYGQWMRDEAFKRIGHLYPRINITEAMVRERPDLKPHEGEKLTVIAWLWARTVRCPNPAFSQVEVPLASTFILSSKAGKEAYVQPMIAKDGYSFAVKVGKPPAQVKLGTSAGTRKGFRCIMSDIPISFEYIREEGMAGRVGQKLMAIVAEGKRGRVYLSPTEEHEAIARSAQPAWEPETPIPEQALSIRVQLYGMKTHGKLFTPRQLVALTTFSDLIGEARDLIRRDAVTAGLPGDDMPLDMGGTGARAYSEAVSVYLGFSLSKQADWCNSLSSYISSIEGLGHLFSKQAIPMVWDFCETNLLSNSAGNITNHVDWVSRMIEATPAYSQGRGYQANATDNAFDRPTFVSTDPPYYDNIGYADLSDFFYVWLRRSLRGVFPNLLSTIAVPKAEELVATPFRHGSKKAAEDFFLKGMTQAMQRLAMQAHPAAPITIYYAFKQSETENDGTTSSGWVTFLDAVLRSGLAITGTWPIRTERIARSVGQGTNALASSIVLVCRPRTNEAGTIGRRKFQRMLNETLPLALDTMTRESEGLHSPVAPVDLSQAIIGPGMAIFSQYEAVLEADGSPMTVRTALQLINRFLAEDDFDSETQFCLHWFEQYGWEAGKFGEADTLARAKGTSVDCGKQAGVLHAAAGNVRLLKWAEYPSDWDPKDDQRLPVWEVLHQLIRVFNTHGETGAAAIFAAVQSKAEAARQLAYRLYTFCERKGWAEDARAYNEVVTSWSGIESAAAKEPSLIQRELFDK
jgi:putative DNA methylase